MRTLLLVIVRAERKLEQIWCVHIFESPICWQISGLCFSEPEDLGRHLFSPQKAWIPFLLVEAEARMVHSEEEGWFGNTLVWGPQKIVKRREERALMCGILSRADYASFAMQLLNYIARKYL